MNLRFPFFLSLLLATTSAAEPKHRITHLEAESFASKNGAVTVAPLTAQNNRITDVRDGDWLLFRAVDLHPGQTRFTARTRIGNDQLGRGGWIEIRLDGPDGDLLGRCLVVAVDLAPWQDRFTRIREVVGPRDICLVFRAASPDSIRLFELDHVSFSDEPITTTGNPIIESHRTADPSVHVWHHHDGDKFWMYASNDMPHATDYSSMDGYRVFSSNDLKTWTDHGEVLHSRDVPWGHAEGGWMWAPDAAYRNGKYYLYFPHKEKSDQPAKQSAWRIGVAVSDRPQGPFIPEPDFIKGTVGTDPACFIDDDGQAYLYFGDLQVARLKFNMKELDLSLDGANAAGRRAVVVKNLPGFMEGAWLHKHAGRYYYSWKHKTAEGFDAHYAIGDHPLGPFDYVGPLNRTPRGAQNHHSIVHHRDRWYFFYHVGGPGPRPSNRRMVCVNELVHNPDGTLNVVEMSGQGVNILK